MSFAKQYTAQATFHLANDRFDHNKISNLPGQPLAGQSKKKILPNKELFPDGLALTIFRDDQHFFILSVEVGKRLPEKNIPDEVDQQPSASANSCEVIHLSLVQAPGTGGGPSEGGMGGGITGSAFLAFLKITTTIATATARKAIPSSGR